MGDTAPCVLEGGDGRAGVSGWPGVVANVEAVANAGFRYLLFFRHGKRIRGHQQLLAAEEGCFCRGQVIRF